MEAWNESKDGNPPPIFWFILLASLFTLVVSIAMFWFVV